MAPGALHRRLFCFPYAGAGRAVFREWPKLLPPDIDVRVPCLPGRDARFDESPATQMGPLASSLARDILATTDLPYAIFGHSMGAFIAFDVAHELAALGRPPSHLFVSAQRGPALPYRGQPIFTLPDEEFLAGVVARYQNIPQPVLEQKDLMAVLLRTLRGDFTLTEDYRYRAAGRLSCPITVFGGEDDISLLPEELEAWADETTGVFRRHTLRGGHFFLNDRRTELLATIAREFSLAAGPISGEDERAIDHGDAANR